MKWWQLFVILSAIHIAPVLNKGVALVYGIVWLGFGAVAWKRDE